MKKRKIWNPSRVQMEVAEQKQCPRCRGFGGTIADRGDRCGICNGLGTAWVSHSGWTLAVGARAAVGKEKLW